MKSVVKETLAAKTSSDWREASAPAPDPIRTPALKVAFDKTLALVGLLLLCPFFAGIALAMAIDGWLHPENRGPVFYKEDRLGQGRGFQLHNFHMAKTAPIGTGQRDKGHSNMKPLEERKDMKTNVGRWLERHYLDQLPHLISIR